MLHRKRKKRAYLTHTFMTKSVFMCIDGVLITSGETFQRKEEKKTTTSNEIR